MNELPPAVELLKDWSIWMVGLVTAILGLVTFFGGKDGFVKLDERWARLAIYFFAGSIFFATWVLAALPSIVLRMNTPTDNFYEMRMFEKLPVPLWICSAAQHWLFMLGVLLFMGSITRKLKTRVKATQK